MKKVQYWALEEGTSLSFQLLSLDHVVHITHTLFIKNKPVVVDCKDGCVICERFNQLREQHDYVSASMYRPLHTFYMNVVSEGEAKIISFNKHKFMRINELVESTDVPVGKLVLSITKNQTLGYSDYLIDVAKYDDLSIVKSYDLNDIPFINRTSAEITAYMALVD
jgi:hypothetical protein